MFEIKLKVLLLVGGCVKVINSAIIYYGYLVALKLINKNEQISNKKEMFVKSFKFSILNDLNEWESNEKREREKKK